MIEQNWGVITALLCTVSMLVGYLSGWRETRMDAEVVQSEDWHRHVQSALFVARP